MTKPYAIFINNKAIIDIITLEEQTAMKTIFYFFSIIILITSPCLAGDEYWGNIEHGDSHTIGNFEYYNDGTSSHQIGNTKYYSDGTSETAIGSFTYRSDGESSTKIGNHTYRSDGNNGVDIGSFHYYDGSSINTIDGFKYRDK